MFKTGEDILIKYNESGNTKGLWHVMFHLICKSEANQHEF
jgi:hypothetical protein